MSNPEKIDAKKRKIKKLFRDLPTEKKQFAEGLINQFAVTSVTLERLADAINNGDLIEDFVQGAQKMRRESPALRAYNTTIKSFSTLTNQLINLLPEKEKKTVFVICAQKSPRKFGEYFRVKIEKNYPGVLIFSGVWCII